MTKPCNKKGAAPPCAQEEPLLSDAQIRTRYLAFLKMLAIETARRDHKAAQDTRDTPPD